MSRFERRSTAPALAACLLTAATLCLAGAGQAEPPPRAALPGHVAQVMPLAAHRATYEVTLLRATGSKSPTAARGRVSYEFGGSACEGYSQTFRQVTEMQPAEGATRVSDMRSATFEDGNGRSFTFDIKTSNDQGPPDVVDGHAERQSDALLAIRLSKPNEQAIDVGNDVLFPTAHLQKIIAAAKAGAHILDVKVFDGSDDGKKVYDTTTIIGRPIVGPAADPGPARAKAMDTMPRWPVTIAYFEDGPKDQMPAYVLGFELYENGVSRALRFDYGDFVLAGQMVSLDLLPTPDCKR
jgi:hypothetical protein